MHTGIAAACALVLLLGLLYPVMGFIAARQQTRMRPVFWKGAEIIAAQQTRLFKPQYWWFASFSLLTVFSFGFPVSRCSWYFADVPAATERDRVQRNMG